MALMSFFFTPSEFTGFREPSALYLILTWNLQERNNYLSNIISLLMSARMAAGCAPAPPLCNPLPSIFLVTRSGTPSNLALEAPD
jgi:hypothetical protein